MVDDREQARDHAKTSRQAYQTPPPKANQETYDGPQDEPSRTLETRERAGEFSAKAERRTLDTREATLREDVARAAADRHEARSSVPDDARERYERVANLRGSGVAEARDGMCQTCHVKLRVQVWAEVRKNESLIECDSCRRILYYEPPPPTVVVEP